MQALGIQMRRIAGDDVAVFELPHAFADGRKGQPHLVRDDVSLDASALLE